MPRSPEGPPEYRDRVRGCLLGGALGDALGAVIEFDPIDAIRHRYGPAGVTGFVPDGSGRTGLITDDTQMTLFTVEGLLRGGDVTAVHHAYLRWLDTQRHPAPPPADGAAFRTGALREQTWLYSRRAPGNACLSGLSRDRAASLPGDQGTAGPGFGPSGGPGAVAPGSASGPDGPASGTSAGSRPDGRGLTFPGGPGPVNPDSKGCGTVMRSAPFGLNAPSPRHAFDLAAACARLTHGHPTGYLAAGAFAAAVHLVVAGEPLVPAVRLAMDLLATYPAHKETTRALRAAVSLAAEGGPGPERVESLGGAWVAEEALAIAVYCALSHPDPGDLGRALLLAVNHSGDSDSTGAVCGNLLGALHGESALPAGWLADLEGRDAVAALADDFATRFGDGHGAAGEPDAGRGHR
ncbi:ADP-ribosylglycohydrolase family protein [Streptosporangium sp. NPDC004379]|uniref:ADP-ribosylglycohydrolase family protein n=1 Tax=Streptosporangium sp. NPDC004379 TaxID=3366189 RepID=UPI003693B9AD